MARRPLRLPRPATDDLATDDLAADALTEVWPHRR
jgi:hypothetical protein